MIVTGMNYNDFKTNIIDVLNRTKYEQNNIVVENVRVFSDNRFSVKLGMSDSRGAGSRRSASGRHGKWCSWYTFFDVMAGVFEYNQDARIQGGNKTYRGRSDFRVQTYDGPQDNVGSLAQPVYMDELSVDEAFDADTFRWEAHLRGEDWRTFADR